MQTFLISFKQIVFCDMNDAGQCDDCSNSIKPSSYGP